MVTAYVDETTKMGQRVLRNLRQNPSAGAIREPRLEERLQFEFEPYDDDRIEKIPRDANGNPIGIPWEEVLEEMYEDLSKHYGVDLRTL